jgi:hypothetical protein
MSPAGLPKSGWGRPRSSEVAGIVDKVSGPTCRSSPLDRDLRDPGRWGPMGTHVSQAPIDV